MTWAELNLDQGLWTIPRERTKNGVPHEVPLSDAALRILRGVPPQAERAFVFGEGRGGFSGWSKSKVRLDARITKSGTLIRPWRLHDLRRTVATRMADSGTLPHVIEAILNHISGHKAGVAGTYNRALYSAEKHEALERWAAHVITIVGETGDVRMEETA
jgi:integrase